MSTDQSTAWPAAEPRMPAPERLAERIEQDHRLDAVADPVAATVRNAIPHGPVKDALSGTWLAHPLHPVLTQVTIGAWTSAVILDVFGGRGARSSADRLVGVGILSALPTAATGTNDWADTAGGARRLGLVHAISNSTALGLYGASYAARRSGRRGTGALLGLAGLAAVSAGGWLGGHLSYARGVGVNQTTFEDWPEDWTAVIDERDVPDEGAFAHARVDGHDVLVSRRGAELHAMAAKCVHRGGPLQDGEAEDGCVVCPLHGSTFRLDDGSVVRGPATVPQPVFDVRVRDGRVEVCRPAE
jgi:nitrite reductase/ring-hydroxylating ferredoxin subunit/uncharacterized membrane protein